MTVPWHPPGWMLTRTGSSHFPPESQVRVVSGSLQGPLGARRHGGRDQLEADVRGWSHCSRTCWAAGLGPLQQANEPRSATNHQKGPSHSLFLQRPLQATCYPALERPLLVGSYPPPQENTTTRDFKHHVFSAKSQQSLEWHSPFCTNIFS